MRRNLIRVVAHEGELMFEIGHVFLDLLDVSDFCSAEIVVLRNKKKIDQINVVHFVTPTGLALTAKSSMLDCIIPSEEHHQQILPEYFRDGDELFFCVHRGVVWDVDYVTWYAEQQVRKQLLPLLERINSIEDSKKRRRARGKYNRRFRSAVISFSYPTPIIFRRKNHFE